MTERRGVVLTVLVGVALVAVAVVSALSGGQVRRLAGEDEAPPSPPPVDAPTAVASPEPLPTLPPVEPGTGQGLGWVLQVLLVVAVAAAIVGIVVLWRRLGRAARHEREPADAGGVSWEGAGSLDLVLRDASRLAAAPSVGAGR